MSDEMSAFGFSAIRFALQPGFEVERLADDEVEGRPSYFVRVRDPSGTGTLFGIDKEHFYVLSAQWQTTKGWHMRQYSEFYQLTGNRFLQPGRVRHYYDGVKSVDIHWRSAEIGQPIPDSTFVLGPGARRSRHTGR